MQSMGICQFRIKFSEIILLHEKIHGKKTLDWSNHKPLLKNIIKLQVQSYFCADNWMQIGCKLLKKSYLMYCSPSHKNFVFLPSTYMWTLARCCEMGLHLMQKSILLYSMQISYIASFNSIYAYLKYMHLWKISIIVQKVNSKFEILLTYMYGKLLHIYS